MPQSLYPALIKIDTSTPLDTKDTETVNTLEDILDVGSRLNKHLEIVTGLELEPGDGEED